MADEDRCVGHCCQGFSGIGEYANLRDTYESALAKEEYDRMPMDRDVLEIFPMLIPLRLPLKDEFSQNVFHPLASIRKTPPSPDELDPEKALLAEPATYSCKNQLPNGDCGIYEKRPHMCRHYPNGRRCEYVMCGSRTMKNLNAHSHVASGGAPFVPLDRVRSSASPWLSRSSRRSPLKNWR